MATDISACILSVRSRLLLPLFVGAVIGFVSGAFRGAMVLAFIGFWGGLMWVLVLSGPVGLWYSARHQHAGGEALTLSTGFSFGLVPWAFYDWYVLRGLNQGEIWFPIALAFLVGLTLAPLFVAIRRSGFGVPAT
jgi:hypothetical protein